MSTHEPDTNESIDARTERALTESMTVLPEGGEIYTVVGENQNGEYRVDAREERCTCPDHTYRGIRCKHLRRVALATGERPVPVGVDGVDERLGEHTDTTPRVAVADGGSDVLDGGDGGEVLDERPEDCDCGAWNNGERVDLPCWPCYRENFQEPNPDATDE